MKFLDFYPLKGTFQPGESVKLRALLHVEKPVDGLLRLTIWRIHLTVAVIEETFSLNPGSQHLDLSYSPAEDSVGGGGVHAQLVDEQGRVVGSATTAFDILPKWTAYPRYGFLSDFDAGREDVGETIELLARFHINGLQFYDWQYKHDQLVAPTETYVDPLGRELSLETIRAFIEAAHDAGMAAMPYLAVYAASLSFWQRHQEMALYDEEGQPLSFMDFLGLMDPSPESMWTAHLVDQCTQALTELPFDGLHVDQYGDPKEAYDVTGTAVDLPKAFSAFIGKLKALPLDAVVTFNAVGNWPIADLAPAPLDFVYIEVWPPQTRYLDLVNIVLDARRLSGGKGVTIALYLPADRPANVRLADAFILSCGGSRIEIGENGRLLADPYFPEHQELSGELWQALRRYADFAVRYGDLIGPTAEETVDVSINAPEGIWHLARCWTDFLTICFVNLSGLPHVDWDGDHGSPNILVDVSVRLTTQSAVRSVWWASPDSHDPQLEQVNWRQEDEEIVLSLPRLAYWSILVCELD